jgi:Flp pilus assembly protein TadB
MITEVPGTMTGQFLFVAGVIMLLIGVLILCYWMLRKV